MPVKFYLRLDSVSPSHIVESLFADNAFVGKLVFKHDEYQLFGAALLLGAKVMKGNLIVETDRIDHDIEGNFKMPSIGK